MIPQKVWPWGLMGYLYQSNTDLRYGTRSFIRKLVMLLIQDSFLKILGNSSTKSVLRLS